MGDPFSKKLVKRGIKMFGGEEAFVEALGKDVSKQLPKSKMGRMKSWVARTWNHFKQYFGLTNRRDVAKMQKERNKMAETGKSLREKENKFENESERLEKLNEKLKSKLVSYHELFDHNQRMIVLGNKLNDLAERFFQNNKTSLVIIQRYRYARPIAGSNVFSRIET